MAFNMGNLPDRICDWHRPDLEQHDVAAEQPERVRRMEAALGAWFEEVEEDAVRSSRNRFAQCVVDVPKGARYEMFRLDGKTAAITGAGSGIGAAIARTFARQGAHVFALDVDEGAADKVCADVVAEGGMAESVRCDVSDASSVTDAFVRVGNGPTRLDVLVNNAGIAHIGNVETTTEANMDRIYAVNVKGVFLCSQAVVPSMVASGGGVILNLASIASLIGLTDRFAYSMSKGAVLTMTRSIAVDYIKQGIRCNCICPARVHTRFVDGYLRDTYPGREAEMFRQLSQYQPIGRMAEPDEVAALALYLCSDEASFITGQAYPIDGGVLVF